MKTLQVFGHYSFRNSLILVLIQIAFSCSGHAQTASQKMRSDVVVEAYDDKGKPFAVSNRRNVEGSEMLNPDWGSGIVFFRNGRISPSMEIQLNLEKNELYFRRDEKTFMFTDSVSGFRVIYMDHDKLYNEIFRSGYPDHVGKKTTYFYQLLVDGKEIQLLLDRSKHLIDAYKYNEGEKSVYREDMYLYAYNVAKLEIVEIKNLKQAKSIIISIMPDRENDINRICDEQKLTMKTREDVIKLVQGLQ